MILKIRLVLVALILFFCACSHQDLLTIVEDGKSEYSIVTLDNDSLIQKSALNLQHYLVQISGVKLPIIHKLEHGEKMIILSTDDSLSNKIDGANDEAFIIRTDEENLYLTAKTAIGCYYAVSAFLEEYLAVIRYNSYEEQVSQTNEVRIAPIYKEYSPAFDFRRPSFELNAHDNSPATMWQRLSSFEDWGMFVHTFHKLLSPDVYYEEHPDYFALIGGRRIANAQPCLSNPEVVATLTENLRKKIEEHPDKKYWSVSQNDYFNYCECDKCQAKYDEYGSISGLYVEMANSIAEEFPDKQISTLAYQFTRSAPKKIVPRENVNIMFCSIECNRSIPIGEDPKSESFIKDLKDWTALTNNVLVWDYVAQYRNLLCPFPNFHVLKPNIQLYKENNVKMMFLQGSAIAWSDFADLKAYLLAKLLWNPEIDADSVIQRYITSYYGEAGPYVQEYFDLLHSQMIKHQKSTDLVIVGYPMLYRESFLTDSLLLRYKELMGNAEMAVQHDSVYLKRVLRQKLVVDYALIDVAMNCNTEKVYFCKKDSDGRMELNQEMMELLDSWIYNAKLSDVKVTNLRKLKVEEYYRYVKRNVEFKMANNLLEAADIKSKTPYSNRYQTGGEKLLCDGETGTNKFAFNWLGYQGEHMILEIDLHEEKEFSEVKMNFLRDIGSWVFLPSRISIEVSVDGYSYHEVANYKSKGIESEMLNFPVPFDFNFSKQKARYLRITAESILECPTMHKGNGGKSWLFVDEVVVF